MALLERLQILIDADAKGAQRELEGIGKAADRELGRAEDRIGRLSSRLTSIGTGAAIGGAVVVGGLAALAKAADEADVQVLKLENSIKNSDQAFRNNGKALQDLAGDLQQVTAADADATIGAQALLVQFGLTEDQVLQLTPLIVDLSRKMGVDMDTAARAVARGVGGSATALKRMGIDIDETALKADSFQAVFDGLAGSVGGFARTEAQTFSGQLEILRNNLGDLGEAVGGGAAGVFGGLAGQAASAVQGLNELNPAVLTAAGGIATTGGIVATVAGGFAFAGGKALEFSAAVRDGTSALTRMGEDGKRELTKVGKAAAGIAIVGAVAATIETVVQVANSVNDIDKKFADATDDFRNALSGADAELLNVFGTLVELEDKSAEFAGIWQGFGTEISLGSFSADVEEVQTALTSVLDSFGPEAAQRIVDGLRAQNEALDQNSTQYRDNAEFIDENQGRINDRREALINATRAERDQNKATREAVALADEQEGAMESLTAATKEYDAKVQLLTQTYGAADAAAKAFSEAIENSTRLDDQASASARLGDEVRTLGQDLAALPDKIDLAALALGQYDEATGDAIEALLQFGETARDALAQAVAAGEDPSVLGAALRERLVAALQAAGIPPEEISTYLGLAGLSEQQIAVAVTVSIQEEERVKFLAFMQFLTATGEELSPEIVPSVRIAVTEGDFARANAIISAYQAAVEGDPVTVSSELGPYPDLAPLMNALQLQANNRRVQIIAEITPTPEGLLSFYMDNLNRAAGRGPGVPPPAFLDPNPAAGIPGGADGDPTTPRRTGGMVFPGRTYEVNEGMSRELFIPASPGFVMSAPDTKRLIAGVQQLVDGGGSSVPLVGAMTVVAPDARLAADEVVRKLADAGYLGS